MFQFFDMVRFGDGHAHDDVKSWRGSFYALAIAADSEDDGIMVDGQELTIGRPLLYDGSPRAFTIEPLRLGDTNAAGTRVRLLGVTDPCGLVAIPTERNPRRYYSADSGAGTNQLIVPFSGRKRASIIIDGQVASEVDVYGHRHHWLPITDYESLIVAGLVNEALGTTDTVGYVIEDEDFDTLVIDVTNAGGATEIMVQVLGEAAR